jgi:hypothetical protein
LPCSLGPATGPLSWATWIQPTPSHTTSLRYVIILSFHLLLNLLCGLFHSGFQISHACYISLLVVIFAQKNFISVWFQFKEFSQVMYPEFCSVSKCFKHRTMYPHVSLCFFFSAFRHSELVLLLLWNQSTWKVLKCYSEVCTVTVFAAGRLPLRVSSFVAPVFPSVFSEFCYFLHNHEKSSFVNLPQNEMSH